MEPTDLRRVVAANIRALAKARGRPLNALADFAGVSRAQMFNVLAGRAAASVDWLAKVAGALDVVPAVLLAEAAENAKPPVAHRRSPFVRVAPAGGTEGAVPLLNLRVAAGRLGRGDEVHTDAWVVPHSRKKVSRDMFVAQIDGESMAPRIPNGSYCLFRYPVRGALEGKIVLVAHRRFHDPETHARYAVKKFLQAKKTRSGGVVRLGSLNPDFKPLDVALTEPDDLRVIAELIDVLGSHEA